MIFMQLIWTVFNKKIHTCERNAIKIDEKENFQDIFIATLSFFTLSKSQDQKQISYGEL